MEAMRLSYSFSLPAIPSWIEANLSNNIELTSILAVPTCSKDWQIAQKGEVVLSEMQNLFNAIQKPGLY